MLITQRWAVYLLSYIAFSKTHYRIVKAKWKHRYDSSFFFISASCNYSWHISSSNNT